MHVLKGNNKVRVLQYFSILSKFKLLESLHIVLQIYVQCATSGLKVYNRTSHVCVAMPIHNLIHIVVVLKIL